MRTILAVAFVACWLLATPTGRADEPAVDDGADAVLRDFLDALAKQETRRAHSLVAPTTRDQGDPIAYRAKADYDSFAQEAAAQPAAKFAAYDVGKRRIEHKDCVRIFVHFKGGDSDETMLVREGGIWYVADPIHIIR